MSHEAVPETRRQNTHTGRAGQAADDQAPARDPRESAAPAPADGAPKGLLQQMEELMAVLNADLSQLDADLQSATDRNPTGSPPAPVGPARSGTSPAGGATPSSTVPGGTVPGGTVPGGTVPGDGAAHRSA
ncbi:hypothetical protein ABZ934_04740 [Streptomyces sp. NPDC046557]|uniref:hypothetical protein n=1 Tax=Streptomyces sp. NPDC046557 TaxID=3155372 RepID=UPI0033E87B6F